MSLPAAHKKLLDELIKCAAEAGISVAFPKTNNGHYQIQGKLLVNYYPFSKNRTAYVAGTTSGYPHVSPKRAVEMAMTRPDLVSADQKDKRSTNTRKIRKRLLRGRACVKCHWCPTIIDLDTSTLDHIIPIAAGGLDNDNNRTLACEPCNRARGHAMPELNETHESTEN